MDIRPFIPLVNLGFLSQYKDKPPQNHDFALHRFVCFLRVLLWHYKLGKNIEDIYKITKWKSTEKLKKKTKNKMKTYWVSSTVDYMREGHQ